MPKRQNYLLLAILLIAVAFPASAQTGTGFPPPPPPLPLDIQLETSILSSYKRGTNLYIVVSVTTDGKPLQGRSVELVGPQFESIKGFSEFAEGRYSVSFPIEDSFPLGETSFRIMAFGGHSTISDHFIDFKTTIAPGDLSLQLIKPDRDAFSAGETMPIVVRVLSPTLKNSANARVTAAVNDNEIVLEPVEHGVFGGSYFVRQEDVGRARLSLKAVDTHGNSGSANIPLEFVTFWILYFVSRNILLVAIIFLAALAVLQPRVRNLANNIRLEMLRNKEKALNTVLKELQDRYFRKKQIKTEEYSIRKVLMN